MTDTSGAATGHSEPTIRGASPYATGGGGVTLERRVAVVYLARLLTGATAVELAGRKVERVAFQQAPTHHVDDLVIHATRDDGMSPLELCIAVRRAPSFAASDHETEKLLGDLVADLHVDRLGGREIRLAICVAGPQPAARQVSSLAALARKQATSNGFFELIGTPGKFKQPMADRLGHLVRLVEANLPAGHRAAKEMTWRLLGCLDVLTPRIEAPDETDWADLLNQLQPWASEPTLAAAAALRDRLEALAASYAPAAADIDRATLCRDARGALRPGHRQLMGSGGSLESGARSLPAPVDAVRDRSAVADRGEPDFLVSYVESDQDWAEWLSWQLTAAGFAATVRAWDAVPGRSMVGWLDQAVRGARRTLVVLSPAALSSRDSLAGWEAAFRADPDGEDRRLIPVIVRECTLEGLLAGRIPIQLAGLDEPAARTAFLAGVEAARSGSARHHPSADLSAHGRSGPAPVPQFPGQAPSAGTAPDGREQFAAAPAVPGTVARQDGDHIAYGGLLPSVRPPYVALPAQLNLSLQTSVLLQARFRVVPFVGRDSLLQNLISWAADDGALTKIQVVTGPGGSGKSRLAAELCHRLAEAGWLTGFLTLEETPATRSSTKPQGPALFVVDYADADLVPIARTATDLIYRDGGHPMRIVLLARAKGSWWTALLGMEPLIENVTADDVELLNERLTPDERVAHYAAAAEAFAIRLRTTRVPAAPPDLSDPIFQFPLLTHIRALLDVAGDVSARGQRAPASRRNSLLDSLLRREAKYWSTGFGRDAAPVSVQLQENCVTVASLAGAASRQELRTLLTSIDDLADASAERLGVLADALHDLYPGEHYLAPLEPDLLTERLVTRRYADGPGLVRLYDHLSTDTQLLRLLTVLCRVEEYPASGPSAGLATAFTELLENRLADMVTRLLRNDQRSTALPLQLMEALRRYPVPNAAAKVATVIPLGAESLSGLAVEISRQTVDFHRRAEESSTAYSQAVVAMALTNYAVWLNEAGRPAESLAPVTEAVDIRARLAETSSVHLSDLAKSLGTAATCLDAVGRHQEALDLAREAATHWKDLARAEAGYRSDLALALNNLSISLADTGEHVEALECARQATTIYRDLAIEDPATNLGLLATSLSNLANREGETNRLELCQEAVGICRTLAKENRQENLGNLARALDNLANRQGSSGDLAAALASSDEACALFQELAATNPDAYLPALSSSLYNIAFWRLTTKNWDEAIRAARGAISIRRRLAERNPEDYLPELAAALRRLDDALTKAGRPADANMAGREALQILRGLVAARGGRRLDDLAESLFTLAARTGGQESVEAGFEAADVFRRLAESDPSTYLPQLALSLRNLAIALAEEQRPTEALTASEEAVFHYRRLAEEAPDTYLPAYGTVLLGHGRRLADAGQVENGLAALREGTDIYRNLVEEGGEGHLEGLADVLFSLAARTDAGESVAPGLEAAEIYRRLAEQDPEKHLPSLAQTLRNLAIALSEDKRTTESVTASEESVAIYRRLVEYQPKIYLPRYGAALHGHARRLGEAGRTEETIASLVEAAEVYRSLATTEGNNYLEGLADVLFSLAARTDAGESVAPGLEAAEIYRRLAEQDPEKHLPSLAQTLRNLAIAHHEARRPEDALATSNMAVETYRRLAGLGKAEYQDAYINALFAHEQRLSAAGHTMAAEEIGRERAVTVLPSFMPLIRSVVEAVTSGDHSAALAAIAALRSGTSWDAMLDAFELVLEGEASNPDLTSGLDIEKKTIVKELLSQVRGLTVPPRPDE